MEPTDAGLQQLLDCCNRQRGVLLILPRPDTPNQGTVKELFCIHIKEESSELEVVLKGVFHTDKV